MISTLITVNTFEQVVYPYDAYIQLQSGSAVLRGISSDGTDTLSRQGYTLKLREIVLLKKDVNYIIENMGFTPSIIGETKGATL